MEYNLSKGFVIIEHRSKNLINVTNEVKITIHTIDMHYSDFALTCYTEIPSVSKIIKKLHIVYDLSSSYIHNFYNYKQESIGDIFSIH